MSRHDAGRAAAARRAAAREAAANARRAPRAQKQTRASAGRKAGAAPAPASAPGAIRVLIADDHQMFREALRRMLQTESGIEVVGEARDGLEVLNLVDAVAADVLLLDLAMPAVSGLDVLKQLSERGSRIRAILLTGTADRQQEVRAIRLGARGVVVKDASLDLLVKSIRDVMAGHYWIGHEQMGDLIESVAERESRRPLETLTRREMQMIRAVVQGATNRQMAQQLGLSAQTIKNHLSGIFDKLGVSSRLELALFAVNHHLIPDEDT